MTSTWAKYASASDQHVFASCFNSRNNTAMQHFMLPFCYYISPQLLPPSTQSSLPIPTHTNKCHPTAQAIAYKYFGEKTVQMNRCVRRSVQAAMTATKLAAVKVVVAVV